MSEDDEENRGQDQTGPVDYDVLDRIGRHLEQNSRFSRVQFRPQCAPNAVLAEYDTGYFPSRINRAYLRISWFETDDFNIHYTEQYGDGMSWECRWDRHPNEHNSRDHFHPPPEASTLGDDEEYSRDWRVVLSRVLAVLDDRIKALWES